MSAWLAALRARADRAPAAPREPLHIAASALPIGSIEPALARSLRDAGLPIAAHAEGWRIVGTPVNDALARIAGWLRDHGLAAAWRDELLRVDDASGASVALIERAAVRPLGITTHAVHLVGWAEPGGTWVQQRALDKATDPGRWDTLMGGLIAGDENIPTTLARETWEEAGLRIAELRDVAPQRSLTVRRPVADGYMVERIHVFEAIVPARLAPQNQDGEVAAFECLTDAALQARLHADLFTLEAALILAEAWARRAWREPA